MQVMLAALQKKKDDLSKKIQDTLLDTPMGEAYQGVQNTMQNLEQKKIDLLPQGVYDMGFGNAEPVAHPNIPNVFSDSVSPLQGVVSAANINNPAANMLTAATGPQPLQDASSLEVSLTPDSPRVLTSDTQAGPMLQQETDEAKRQIEQDQKELEKIENEIDRKQGMLKVPEGAHRVEEMLLASGLLRDRDEDEVTQIGAAAPIYLS
tara:strand:- start:141 stop:761 length:621 start_codon:yes stop_codon:yes gene_type:complete